MSTKEYSPIISLHTWQDNLSLSEAIKLPSLQRGEPHDLMPGISLYQQ
jgi:hypothetical protein